MKEKIITIKVNGAAQGQWSHLLLELNLMKKAWKPYGVDMILKASGLKNVINHGTKVHDGSNYTKRRTISVLIPVTSKILDGHIACIKNRLF